MFTPPNSCKKREPPPYERYDIAGMGEKPKTRSGPYFFAVYKFAAATISSTSSQFVRRNPPLPRAFWIRLRFSSSSMMDFHASTGLFPLARASRQKSSNTPRAYGYLTRIGLYTYHDAEIPR